MKTVITEVGAFWTPSPERPGAMERLSGGEMLLEDGKIAALGPRGTFPRDVETWSAEGGVVTPGLVDCHQHPAFADFRAGEFVQRNAGAKYAEIAAAGGGIRASVRSFRAASDESIKKRIRSAWRQGLRYGTTTVEGKSGYGLNLHQELRALRLLGEVGEELGLTVRRTLLAAHDVPDEYRERREDYVTLVCNEIIPAVAAEGLAEAADVFCETGVFSVAESRAILQAARERGLRLRLHADQLSASGGSLLAAELGAVSADHLEEIADRGISALRESGVVAVMLPGSTYFLGMENYAPARKLLDSGVLLALATNYNPGSSMFISLPNIMNMAAVHQHLKPAEAFWAATRGGALVLGLEERKGLLTPGGDADVLVWKEATDLEEIVYQPNIQPDLVFTGGRVRRDLC